MSDKNRRNSHWAVSQVLCNAKHCLFPLFDVNCALLIATLLVFAVTMRYARLYGISLFRFEVDTAFQLLLCAAADIFFTAFIRPSTSAVVLNTDGENLTVPSGAVPIALCASPEQ